MREEIVLNTLKGIRGIAMKLSYTDKYRPWDAGFSG